MIYKIPLWGTHMVDKVDDGFDKFIVEGDVVKIKRIVQYPSSSI
jgi:hypothetical protein